MFGEFFRWWLEQLAELLPERWRRIGGSGDALAFEMDRETPFKPEELFWSHHIARRDRQTGQLLVRLLLLPRARLERLLAALDRAGISPRWAEIGAGPDRGSRLPLGGEGGRAQGAA